MVFTSDVADEIVPYYAGPMLAPSPSMEEPTIASAYLSIGDFQLLFQRVLERPEGVFRERRAPGQGDATGEGGEFPDEGEVFGFGNLLRRLAADVYDALLVGLGALRCQAPTTRFFRGHDNEMQCLRRRGMGEVKTMG